MVTVASSGGRPLLGAVRDGKPILLVDGAEVPLTSSGGYAEGSRWQSLAVDGVRVAAVSGERGGAHGNVRWTVWTGTTAGVKDEPQPFETFGGWGMGQLVAVTYVSGRPLVIGSWQSDTAGFDIAVWRREDPASWQRAAMDPVMSSTRSALVQPAAATGFGDRLIIVGPDERPAQEPGGGNGLGPRRRHLVAIRPPLDRRCHCGLRLVRYERLPDRWPHPGCCCWLEPRLGRNRRTTDPPHSPPQPRHPGHRLPRTRIGPCRGGVRPYHPPDRRQRNLAAHSAPPAPGRTAHRSNDDPGRPGPGHPRRRTIQTLDGSRLIRYLAAVSAPYRSPRQSSLSTGRR